MEESITLITVALISSLFGPLIVEYTKNFFNIHFKKKKDSLYEEMEFDILINEQLQYLRDKLDCDRVWIMQFHNGGHYYYSDVSIKKFSFFYEILGIGIAPVRDKFQNIPTSFFSRSIKEIHDNDELCINNMDDNLLPTYGLKDTAKLTGCQSLFITSLKTPSGNLHGALGVEFVKDHREFTEEQKELIRESSIYVSGTLSLIHKYK